MRIIRTVLTIIIIVLAAIVLIGNVDGRVIMPYMFTCLGTHLIFNGIHFYKKGKKTDGMLLFLTSIFVLGVVVKIAVN